jgi:hypothetical protein
MKQMIVIALKVITVILMVLMKVKPEDKIYITCNQSKKIFIPEGMHIHTWNYK